MRRLLWLGIVGAFFSGRVTAESNCSATTFVQPASFPTGGSSQAVAVGDFTNDGKLDIVVGLTPSTVAVLPGDGAGGFGAPLSSQGIYQPAYIVTGHFDPDANLDIAIVSAYGGLAVLLGNGNGTFQSPVSYDTGYGPSGLVIGDFNRDGFADLALTTDNGSSLTVLIGNGNGSFQAPVLTTLSDTMRSLSIGDFDGDGNPDLVAPGASNTVHVYPGLGNGTFGLPTELEIGSQLQGSAVGHLGGAFLDFAVLTDTYVAVVLGNGDGTFQAAVEYPLITYGYTLLAADLDGDGRDDLVALTITSSSAVASVLVQQPGGTFEGHFYEVGQVTPYFAAGDFEGDGKARLALAAYQDNQVLVVQTTGAAPLLAPQTVTTAGPPRAIAWADFGDPTVDLAVLGDQIQILALGDDGYFHVRTTTPTGSPETPVAMTLGDFNVDGKIDVAVTSYSQLTVLLGNGDGTFQPPVAYSGVFGQQWITIGDYNGDGLLDLVLTDTSNGNFGEVTVFFNTGAGAFVQGPSTPLAHPPNSILSNAFDGNNPEDLVTTNGQANSISVLKGNGDGTFQPPVDYATGPSPIWAAVGNFNGDGAPDLAVANSGGSNVTVLYNDGNGGFDDSQIIGIGWTPSYVAVTNFNLDGFDDIVTANYSSQNVSILLGTAGGFQSPKTVAVSGNPIAVEPAAVRGAPDLAVAIQTGPNRVSILENAKLSALAFFPAPVIVGSAAHLVVHAEGDGALTYQWKKNGILLSDGGPISGSSTSTLTIDPVSFADATAVYDYVITDWCTSLEASYPALSVEFDDVPLDNPFHNDILRIATLGVTSGCTPTSFCPSNDVSRAEMAVFLLKSKYGADHVPPPPAGSDLSGRPGRHVRRGLDRRARDARHHNRLRQRPLLSGPARLARRDGGLPVEDAARLGLRPAGGGRHLRGRAARLLRGRLDRGHLQPRHHSRLRDQSSSLLPRLRRSA